MDLQLPIYSTFDHYLLSPEALHKIEILVITRCSEAFLFPWLMVNYECEIKNRHLNCFIRRSLSSMLSRWSLNIPDDRLNWTHVKCQYGVLDRTNTHGILCQIQHKKMSLLLSALYFWVSLIYNLENKTWFW